MSSTLLLRCLFHGLLHERPLSRHLEEIRRRRPVASGNVGSGSGKDTIYTSRSFCYRRVSTILKSSPIYLLLSLLRLIHYRISSLLRPISRSLIVRPQVSHLRNAELNSHPSMTTQLDKKDISKSDKKASKPVRCPASTSSPLQSVPSLPLPPRPSPLSETAAPCPSEPVASCSLESWLRAA